MASSSSSSTLMKYHVFLSFRGEDTRLNFTTHLLQALKDEGLDVFFDEEKLERGDQLSQALSRAIAVSNISIIVLSADYASSKSCLVELSDIMDRYSIDQQIVLPIFYHVNPSDVENIDGSFKKSFDEHETRRSVDEVKQWKTAFAEVGKLEGWHIDGSISDRPETQHIKDIVAYVMRKLMKHQVFLSLGEDTRLNFSNHLVNALEKVGINVFPDNETLKKGEKLPPTYSRAISASNLSILVLSKAYASSKSCLGELSDIMDRKHNHTDKHIVLPIFYHVDPSDVRNSGGHFKTSFEEHESEQPADRIQQWKTAFAEVGKLKGWHIEGGKFDRPETQYIKDVVEYVIKKLSNIKSGSASEELVGIDDQKRTILKLIKQKDCRVLGLWGMGGQGKTTLAEAVYKKISLEFESCCFLQNVREEIEKQGKKSLRNELLSKLLNSDVDIDTPSIGSTLIQERLNNKKVLVVLDDISDPNQIDCMGVKHLGSGSKIIITSREKQVLKSGGADTIHEVKALNKNDSLQLFSTFAFKQLNPEVDFRDLSCKFVEYSQGSPLALRVLGCNLYGRTINDWGSEMEKLGEYSHPEIFEVLKSSYDGLGMVEKNIFLDIACFFKGEPIKRVKHVLSCYRGVEDGISKLVSKCLINISSSYNEDIISMHDMLEELGKDIIRQKSKTPGKCRRLWSHEHIKRVLKYNQGTDRIQGMKLNMSHMDKLLLCPLVFENITNLKYIIFYSPKRSKCGNYQKLYTNQVDFVSLPDELKYLRWDDYPCKSLSSSFNPKNLVVLKLPHGDMEQLWDGHQNLANLREIDVSYCKNLRKLPNLSEAINLELLHCSFCKSLVEFWNEDDHIGLVNLREIRFNGCVNLRKIPNFSRAINLEILDCFYCTSLVELWNEDDHMGLVNLREIQFGACVNLRKIPNFSRAINLEILDCSGCTSLVELWNEDDHMGLVNLREIQFDGCVNLRKIPNFSKAIKLEILDCFDCISLVELWNEDDHMGLVNLREIRFNGCVNLRKMPNFSRAINLDILDCSNCTSLVELWNEDDHMGLVTLTEIRFIGCVNLRKIPNFSRAINLKILDCSDCTSLVELWNKDDHMGLVNLREIRLRECVNLRKIPNFSKAINLKILDCSDCTSLVELWNEDDHMGLVNLREIRFNRCVNLRKMPNFSRAINLDILDCSNCTSLVELWSEDDHRSLVNLREIRFRGCVNLRKIPNVSRAINLKILDCSDCKSLVELWNEDDHMGLVNLREIRFGGCLNLRKIPNISRAINLEILDCSNCTSLVELWNEDDHMGFVNLREIRFRECVNLRKIPNFSRAINLEILDCSNCTSLVELWNEEDHMGLVNLREIRFRECVNLRKIPNFSRAINLEILDCSDCTSLVELWNEDDHMGLVNLRTFQFGGCMNLRKIPNFSRAINLEILDCSDCTSLVELWNEDDYMGLVNLKILHLDGCVNLRKIPNLSRAINLQILDCSNCTSLVELWNEDDHMDLIELKKIYFSGCVNLKKIPNLLGAINLKFLDCSNCESLVQLPCLDHLASLHHYSLRLNGCYSLKKFPQVPSHFRSLNLSETGIEEVPDSIKNLHKLETLLLANSQVKKVSIKMEFLRILYLSGCPMVELLSELPPYLKVLTVNDCKSLEKVSFADQNLNQFDSLNDDCEYFFMLFCNCFKLNQESTNNIEANAMLKIGSLAEKWAARSDWKYRRENFPSLVCCFPGHEISANKFKYRSLNSSLSLKIAPNRGSGSRFLVFAICLVANLGHRHDFLHLLCSCEYQLTAAGGGNGGVGCENFRSEIPFSLSEPKYMGYHVFILSSIDMVIEDKNYEEASFKFYIRLSDLRRGGKEYIKVERCGVHVLYVDKKSDTGATEKRVAGNKRSFSRDGEEGDGGLKRLK